MKQTITILIWFVSLSVYSCDICGGISMPSTQGILPGTKFHYVGLRSSWIQFHTNEDISHLASKETFFRTELNGRYQFNKRISAQISVPYVINIQFKGSETTSISGIGDIHTYIYWNVIMKENTERRTNFTLRLGSGLKTPTGSYSRNVWETNNLYPGTGAFDYGFSSYLSWNKGKLGFINENLITIKTANPVGYKFGNAYLSRFMASYNLKVKQQTLFIPFVGITAFMTDRDQIQNIPVGQTFNSGVNVLSESGITLFSNKMMYTLKCGLPLFQELSGGEVKMNGTLEFSINYLINKK